MLDRLVKSGWAAQVVIVPLLALGILSENPSGELIFCTLAFGWAWMMLVPRETPTLRWMPILFVALGMGCGLGVIHGRFPWLGPSLCLLAIGLGISASRLESAVRWLIVTAALSAALVRASGGDFGPDPFSNWLASIGLSPEMAWNATVFLRKTVHFTYFGLIGWTAYRGVRTLDVRMIWWWPLGWGLLNASLDETRQHFVAGRTGSVWDVLLDMAGAATFIFVANRKWTCAPKDLAPESDSPP